MAQRAKEDGMRKENSRWLRRWPGALNSERPIIYWRNF